MPFMERFRDVGFALAAIVAATLAALGLRIWPGIEDPSSVYLLSVAAVALVAGTGMAVTAKPAPNSPPRADGGHGSTSS